MGNGPAVQQAPNVLSAREREVLTSFATGTEYAEIANAMGVSKVPVRNAIHQVRNKLGVGSKHKIVKWAVRNGLFEA